MCTAANLLDLHLVVISPLPMQHEPYGFTVACRDDLLERDAKETLFVLGRTLWIVPEFGEIRRELEQLPLLSVAQCPLANFLQVCELGFQLRLRPHRLFPP